MSSRKKYIYLQLTLGGVCLQLTENNINNEFKGKIWLH